MPVPAVTRRTDRGLPRYDDTDTFLFPGAEDLVPVLEPDGAGGWRRPAPAEPPHASGYRVDRYRPRTEGAFTRIERWTRLAAGAGRRAIRRSRMRYRADDLSGPLPLGTAGALALPYRTDQLALTDGLVGAVLHRDGTALLPDPAAVLGGECGYLDEDGQWWAPSGQAIYGPNGAGDFYLPTGFTDPFGNTTTVTHDRYRLLPIAVTDPFGNVAR